MTECDIRHDDRHGYYTLTVNGQFEGNFDTMREAALEYEQIVKEKKEEKKHE